MANYWNKFRRGQMLVELMVAMAMATMLMPAIITSFFAVRGGANDQEYRVMALGRVREAKEIIALLKVKDWTNVATNGIYKLVESSGNWSIASGEENIGPLHRKIEIRDAYRDGNGKLATVGTSDPSTKRVIITVTWSSGGLTKLEVADYYLMRLENLSYIETTQTEFNSGTKTGTTVVAEGDGAVTLGAGGGGNWCEPALTMTSFDLPKSGAANAVSAIEGRIFAGTGDNASGVSFANLSVNASNPPVVTLLGTYDGYKTNDIFGEANYAYLGTDNNSKEVVIVNLTSLPYTQSGYYDVPGVSSAESIYVDGTVGYVLSGSKLYSFNLTQKTGSRPGYGNVSLAGQGRAVYVKNGYAYVVNDSTNNEFQIVDVSNPSSMQVVSTFNVSGQRGVDVYVNQTSSRAFVATEGNASLPEFFVINIENKSAPSAIGGYDTQGMAPTGLRVVTFNRVVIVGYGGTEYQVVDVSSESSPAACGTGLNIDAGIRDIDSVFTPNSAYSYIVTGDATQELRLIEGGPGGQYATDGVYISDAFDASHSAVFNRFEVEANLPPQTNIKYQVAVADAVAGSCAGATYEFMGPNLSSSDFFTGNAQLPLGTSGAYTNPGQCMKYKAYLTTAEGTVAPSLLSITFNYSP